MRPLRFRPWWTDGSPTFGAHRPPGGASDDDGFQIALQEARTAAERDFPDLAAHLHDQAQTLLTVDAIAYAPPPNFELPGYMDATPFEYQADQDALAKVNGAFEVCLSHLTTYMTRASSVVDETGLALRKIVDLYSRADGQG